MMEDKDLSGARVGKDQGSCLIRVGCFKARIPLADTMAAVDRCLSLNFLNESLHAYVNQRDSTVQPCSASSRGIGGASVKCMRFISDISRDMTGVNQTLSLIQDN